MTDRREFLIGCGSLVAAAGMPSVSLAAISERAASETRAGAGFSRAAFESWLNARFRVSRGRRALLEATLERVEQGRSSASHDEFAVTFAAADAVALPAGIYSFRNARAGKFQLYIEPATSAGARTGYRASFSLLS